MPPCSPWIQWPDRWVWSMWWWAGRRLVEGMNLGKQLLFIERSEIMLRNCVFSHPTLLEVLLLIHFVGNEHPTLAWRLWACGSLWHREDSLGFKAGNKGLGHSILQLSKLGSFQENRTSTSLLSTAANQTVMFLIEPLKKKVSDGTWSRLNRQVSPRQYHCC